MLNNFIYAKQKSLFEEALNNGLVLDEAIVFIEDTKEIWNHGTYFGTPTIPVVNDNTLTIQKNGTTVDSWSGNSAQNKTINITIDKNDVNLGNVNNTADIDKPVSTATQAALDTKMDKVVLADVATSGSYNDLLDKPEMNDGVLTISRNNTSVGTFSANQSGPSSINISVPTKVSELTNDEGYLSAHQDISHLASKTEVTTGLATKVDKVDGKQLSTEDFTKTLKEKLEGLNNYDDTAIQNSINSLQTQLNTLVNADADTAIDTFNEIIAFLNGIDNTESLDSIIAGINTEIAKKADKSSLATVATSGSYNDLSNKPSIPVVYDSSVTIQKNGVSVGTFTANASTNKTINIELVKGDVGLGNVDNTSDVNKPISTATQTALNAKQAALVSGTNIKTVNGTSLLGSGDVSVGVTGVKGNSESTYRTGQVNITPANLGITVVNNTADANKSVKHAGTADSATTATTATNLAAAPSLSASGNNITITAGGKTSSAFAVPYAAKAEKDASGNVITSTYLSKTDASATYLGKTAKAASATSADSATKATQDASGNVITSTYATKSEVTTGLNGKIGQNGTVTAVVAMTQAQYDALGSNVSATTLYIITD